jgi:hypothetical protein
MPGSELCGGEGVIWDGAASVVPLPQLRRGKVAVCLHFPVQRVLKTRSRQQICTRNCRELLHVGSRPMPRELL